MPNGQTDQSFFIRYKRYISGLLIGCIILFIIYSPEIFGNRVPTPISVSLCEYAGSLRYEFIEVMEENVNVPDYYANIFIEPTPSTFILNSNGSFTLKVTDEGIQEITNGYFYIFLFDPDKDLRAIFPCYCGTSEYQFGIEGYECRMLGGERDCYIKGAGSKFPQWHERYEWTGDDGKPYHCNNENGYYCIQGACRPKTTFLEGEFEGHKYHYTFTADKEGTWEIHAFLFDEEYEKRDFDKGIDNEIFDNAIVHRSAKLEVTPNYIENKVSIWWHIGQVVKIIVLVLAPTMLLSIAFYNWAERFVIRYKYQIILFILALIIVMILCFSFCKVSCPL
ncbi:MAG: hypothetical protein ACTSUP_02865 [Candidatus Heimdallarchaeaceae archaeon]